MEENKFRVWHKKDKEHYPVISINWKTKEIYVEYNETEEMLVNPNDVILEQYVNLDAENDKELYEGDIIRYYRPLQKDYVVVTIHGYYFWSIYWDDNKRLISNIEVVGNTHENKESDYES